MNSPRKIFFVALTLLALTASAHAQSPREQLQQLTIQLQQTPNDNALRERIIKLGAELKPAPAVPEEAIRYEGRAQFAFKSAQTKDDFLTAAKEYEKAVAAAPWVLGYYSDLCTIYEKVGEFETAKRNCGFYLTGLSDPEQMTDVKRRIAGLDFGVEKTKSQEDQVTVKFTSFLRTINGVVYRSALLPSGGYIQAQVQDKRESRAPYELLVYYVLRGSSELVGHGTGDIFWGKPDDDSWYEMYFYFDQGTHYCFAREGDCYGRA